MMVNSLFLVKLILVILGTEGSAGASISIHSTCKFHPLIIHDKHLFSNQHDWELDFSKSVCFCVFCGFFFSLFIVLLAVMLVKCAAKGGSGDIPITNEVFHQR